MYKTVPKKGRGNPSFFHAHLEPGLGAQLWPQQSAILQDPVAVTLLEKRKNEYELEKRLKFKS